MFFGYEEKSQVFQKFPDIHKQINLSISIRSVGCKK